MKNRFISVLLILLACDVAAQKANQETLPSLIPYRQKDKWGYCDQVKKIVIPAIYSSVSVFEKGYAIVSIREPQYDERPQQGEQIIIDSTGKEVYRWTYKGYNSIEFKVTSNGIIQLWEGGRLWLVRGRNGYILQPTRYKLQWPFNDHYYVATKGKYFGVIDSMGKTVIPFRYRHIGMMDETGYALARKKDSSMGLIDLQRKELFPLKPKNYKIAFGFFGDKLAAISDTPGFDNLWGYVDTAGSIVIPMLYKDILPFTEGLAAVGVKGRQGFINTKGDTVIPFRYSKLDPFKDGRAQFSDATGYGVLDKKGREIIRIKQEIMQYINDNLLVVRIAEPQQGNLMTTESYQLVDGKGNPIDRLPHRCNYIWYQGNNLFLVIEKGDPQGYFMDIKGNKYYEK